MKRMLLQYFESHPIQVVTSFGLRGIFENQLATGRIAKWALELIGLDIPYVPQTAVKSQALVDFVAECTETQQPTPPPSWSPKSIGACISIAPSPSMVPGEA
jgi:hypothetical protein